MTTILETPPQVQAIPEQVQKPTVVTPTPPKAGKSRRFVVVLVVAVVALAAALTALALTVSHMVTTTASTGTTAVSTYEYVVGWTREGPAPHGTMTYHTKVVTPAPAPAPSPVPTVAPHGAAPFE